MSRTSRFGARSQDTSLSPELADRIYSILVEKAGASEYWRQNFIQVQGETPGCREYRFQGALGFGGKLRRNGGRLYVDYYPEDRSPERDAIVEATNEALAALGVPESLCWI